MTAELFQFFKRRMSRSTGELGSSSTLWLSFSSSLGEDTKNRSTLKFYQPKIFKSNTVFSTQSPQVATNSAEKYFNKIIEIQYGKKSGIIFFLNANNFEVHWRKIDAIV